MTNEELKKKICKIIADNYLPKEMPDRLEDYKLYRFARAADALISAGIGDVKDLKAQVGALEMTNIALQAGYDGAEEGRLYWVDKCKEAEHRAEIVERALSSLVHEMYEHGIRPMCDEKFFTESRLKEAEKELVEEK